MAACLPPNNLDLNQLDYTSDNEPEETEKNAMDVGQAENAAPAAAQEEFVFPNSNTCWVCNGYYGPNFEEPLCGTCHSFLHSTNHIEELDTHVSDVSDEDSGNDEPPFKDRQEPDDEDEEDEDEVDAGHEEEDDDEDDIVEVDVDVADEDDDDDVALEALDAGAHLPLPQAANLNHLRNFEVAGGAAAAPIAQAAVARLLPLPLQRPPPEAPPALEHYVELLSNAQANAAQAAALPAADKDNILALPVEIMIKIFSYLDDLSLWRCSESCHQWLNILEQNTSQLMWKKYFKERWPLFQAHRDVQNWLKLYKALMSSCFCRICVIQMGLKKPRSYFGSLMRMNFLRNDIRLLNNYASEGIKALPLDKEKTNWQASILGPVGSPYEGGKFFLYIFFPERYPMKPPTVRFLTKILHPNVSRHGDVGIDIFQHNWSLALNVSKVLLSVQSLLTDPYTEVCMEPVLGHMYEHNRARYEKLARSWTWKYAMLERMRPR